MRLLLRPHRPGLSLVGIIQPRLLHDRAAILQDRDLAAGLIVDGGLDEAHGVHVLDFAARAQMAEISGLLEPLVIAGLADADVHVGAQVAVLHVAVAGAQIAQDLAQLDDIGGGLFGAADVGAADDLHQGHPGAVQVDEGHGRVHVVDRLARVLFQVDALDADAAGDAGAHVDDDLSLAHDGLVQLADLIALRQVGIEIVLAIECAAQVDLGLQAQAGAHRLRHAEFVDDRQHARHGRVDEGHVAVGLGAKACRRAGKQLGIRCDLGVNLQPDHQLPIALRALDHFGLRGGEGQVKHGGPLWRQTVWRRF